MDILDQLLFPADPYSNICASCEPTCDSVNCQNCKRVINGYSKVEKDQKPPAGSPTEQTTCSVSFRDNNDKVIALPTIYNISAKINSLKIYEAIRMYFYSVMGFIYFHQPSAVAWCNHFYGWRPIKPYKCATILILKT